MTAAAAPSPETCDLLIQGGTVVDGTGQARFHADVAVTADRIVAVGSLQDWRARRTINATGLVVAPGFIDIHTHDDRALVDDPAMAAKVTQGVTTVVTGLCGLSLAPSPPLSQQLWPEPFGLLGARDVYAFPTLASYFAQLQKAPPSVNVAALVGHASLRALAMTAFDRAATPAEMRVMKAALREAMQAGTFGLSSGLAYEAGRDAPTEEVVELAAEMARFDGLYVTHMRDEGDRVEDALYEALDIGRRADCPVIISHHKCLFRRNWGRTKITLATIDKARSHQAVAMDVYPYTASSTVLTLDRVKNAERVIVAWSDQYPDAAGRDLDEIAAEWLCDRDAAVQRLIPGGGVYFNMDENDLRRVMAHPCCMIGSDGVPAHRHPHPRLWGTFPRVLGRYVREERVLTLEQAVHRMTGLPANVFALRDRGIIRAGAMADIVVFDPQTIADAATYSVPVQASKGISHVLVNGVSVLIDGVARHAPAGRVLKRSSRRKSARTSANPEFSHAF
ncbi:MAG: N-acyl-D-amino-acid deacylase family protein [Beijerinckiaceae bacterium]